MALQNSGALAPIKNWIDSIAGRIAPNYWKHFRELNYWKNRKRVEGTLSDAQYSYAYLEHFGLSTEFYNGKRILDIGCGPRGSLEWATMAAERVGLDPLANEYLKLGADKHSMRYVQSPSERIPFEDGHFDVVCSFNSLDHVDDLESTLTEIIRVTAPGGLFLLLVETNHEPTPTEPHSIDLSTISRPELEMIEFRYYREEGGTYEAIRQAEIPPTKEPAILSVKFKRR